VSGCKTSRTHHCAGQVWARLDREGGWGGGGGLLAVTCQSIMSAKVRSESPCSWFIVCFLVDVTAPPGSTETRKMHR